MWKGLDFILRWEEHLKFVMWRGWEHDKVWFRNTIPEDGFQAHQKDKKTNLETVREIQSLN